MPEMFHEGALTCVRAAPRCSESAVVNEAKRDISYTPGGMASLTPSESPGPHVIVVKDQRETIKNAFHACRVFKLHMCVVVRTRLQEAAGEPAVEIYEIFIEPFLSCIP
jgi:hypothetical protein